MADKNLLAQMLENLVNNDQAKAEELFHEYVVAKSREIYEDLIESEIEDEDDKEVEEAADDEEAEEDKVEEAADDEEAEEDKMDENFEDIAYEGDDEMGGDATDDLEGELDGEEEMGDEEEKSEEELFMDLESIVDELQAKFDELKGGDHEEPDADNMGGPSDMDADNAMKDDFDLATVREYVEKVPAGHGAEKKGQGEKADNTTSIVASKNDMGGTTANILSGKNGSEGSTSGALKGNGLLKGNPKEENAGNVNVPGAKNGNAFSKKEPGHGAEKKGAAEQADNKQSLFRGRR
jgi:hypothetical protein